MRVRSRIVVACASLMLLSATAGFAQMPGGMGQGRPGMSGPFAQFREQHKFTFQLMQTVRHIGEIDKDPKYSLTAAQAKQVLAVLKPLRSKPKLTQDEAKQALKGLKKALSANQLNAMARIKSNGPGRRPGMGGAPGTGGRGMGAGRPGGNGRPGAMRMDPNAMKNFNPFYTGRSGGSGFAAERNKRMNDLFAGLERKAKGGKVSPKPRR